MGDSNTVDSQKMKRDLIASATADPAAFVERVMANFNDLTDRISKADARILEMQTSSAEQAALITELSLQKDQAAREAEQILSRARQEAAEIISDAKSQAKQLTNQAETKLINANVEADSIKTTKLNMIRGDINLLENRRMTEREQTLEFLRMIGDEYDGIIDQCSQTLSKLRTTRTYVLDQVNAVESTSYEHFDVNQYLPKHTYQAPLSSSETTPADAQPASAQSPIVPVPPMPAAPQPAQPASVPVAEPVAPVVEPVAQPVAQQPAPQQRQGYVDNDGIIPTERSFNDLFQMGGSPVANDSYGDDLEPVDEFGDSGLLMEAMSGLEDDKDDFTVSDPSDSGLLMDALNSIDDVEEQRDIAEFAEMDDFDDDFDSMPSPPPTRQRIKVPQRRRGNHSQNRGWTQ